MSTCSLYSRRDASHFLRAVTAPFSDCDDFQSRTLKNAGQVFHVYWLDGLVSSKDVAEDILRPLTDPSAAPILALYGSGAEELLSRCIWACASQLRRDAALVCQDLLNGCCAVIPEHSPCAAVCEVKSGVSRAVSAPTAEKTIKGGKDAFVETLRTNTALVRRRLHTADLKLIQRTAGRRSRTSVAVLYLESLAAPDLPRQLLECLDALDVDALRSAGNLEQYITARPASLFPQLLHTERPDIFASGLLEGRIGLFVDGFPLGFLLPAVLSDFLRVEDDRAQHFGPASLLVLLRWIALLFSLLLPGLVTAAVRFHPEMIPTRLLLSIIEAKYRVPFSITVEMLVMFLMFELLMEAGLRLPDQIGDTVSIIGGLIIGQAAVEARVVSPISVIVVAAASICGFVLPSRDLAAANRLLRFLFILLGAALGFYGISLGMALLVCYLSSLETFGAPYLSPFSEGGFRASVKALVQLPLFLDKYRAYWVRATDRRNQR